MNQESPQPLFTGVTYTIGGTEVRINSSGELFLRKRDKGHKWHRMHVTSSGKLAVACDNINLQDYGACNGIVIS